MILIQGYRKEEHTSDYLLIYTFNHKVIVHASWNDVHIRAFHDGGGNSKGYIPILPTDTLESLWNQQCD